MSEYKHGDRVRVKATGRTGVIIRIDYGTDGGPDWARNAFHIYYVADNANEPVFGRDPVQAIEAYKAEELEIGE